MNRSIAHLSLLSALLLPTAGCGTLSDAATIVANTDWAALLQTAHETYNAVAGPLFKACAEEQPGSAFDAVCGELAKLDTAAEAALATADIAVSTGQNVSAAVQQAQDNANIIANAFKSYRASKAQHVLRERAVVSSVASKGAPDANTFRTRAQEAVAGPVVATP